jgi:hypothetical protein
MGEACNEAKRDGVGHKHKHNRNRVRFPLQRSRRRDVTGQKHIWGEVDQLPRASAHAVDVACSPAIINPEVSSNLPSELSETLMKYRDPRLLQRIILGKCQERADPAYSLALLRGSVA